MNLTYSAVEKAEIEHMYCKRCDYRTRVRCVSCDVLICKECDGVACRDCAEYAIDLTRCYG